MRPIPVLGFLAASLLLAACGGGGGGGNPVPVPISTSQPPTAQAVLKAGFNQGSGTQPAAVARRGTQTIIRRPMGSATPAPTLNGAVVPVADFIVPDGYIQTVMAQQIGAAAIAYLDTSNGSTLPSPLPTVAWQQSGNPIPTTPQTITPTPAPSGQNTTVIGALNVSNPPETGVSYFTATAGGQTVNFSAYTYLALGISMGDYPLTARRG